MENIKKILDKLNKAGYDAYVVGGYVRDFLLNKTSLDVDITTSATPKQISEIFNVDLSDNLGNVRLVNNNRIYEITTFRKEYKYINNRYPGKIKYIKSLRKDLLRRDFTINTICMDRNGQIIDLNDGINDLNNKVIRMIGNPKYRLKQDSLRILRAIRFSTVLNFEIDSNLKKYIKKYSYLLKKLSFDRKRNELDLIFRSKNILNGLRLLNELNVVEYLYISNLDKIEITSDICGIWAQIEFSDKYVFDKKTNKKIKILKEMLNKNILEPFNLYYYGLEYSTIICEIKHIEISTLVHDYHSLPIKKRSDIDIELNKLGSNVIKNIEYQILNGNLVNKNENIKNYIIEKYK